MASGEIAVAYSGGTDSTCVAALMAERFARVHLLTFWETGTKDAPNPTRNVEALRARFGKERIAHALLSTDGLLRALSYERYLSYVARHGFFMLSNCGFSSLSWHMRTIMYCLDHGIGAAADGVTRELVHFPGHMDVVLEEIRRLYRSFGIDYSNPVRDWDVPPDQQFVDKLVVGRHLDAASLIDSLLPAAVRSGGGREAGVAELEGLGRTTGRYLYERGLLPHPNVKGTDFDRSMQHDCYPFVLFNIFAFWYYLPWHDFARYEERMKRLFREKVDDAIGRLESYRKLGDKSELAALVRG